MRLRLTYEYFEYDYGTEYRILFGTSLKVFLAVDERILELKWYVPNVTGTVPNVTQTHPVCENTESRTAEHL